MHRRWEKVSSPFLQKMKEIVIAWLSIYPTLTFFSILLDEEIKDFPIPLRVLILTLIVVPIAIKLVIPLNRKLFT